MPNRNTKRALRLAQQRSERFGLWTPHRIGHILELWLEVGPDGPYNVNFSGKYLKQKTKWNPMGLEWLPQ
jgi:hypothetical protein